MAQPIHSIRNYCRLAHIQPLAAAPLRKMGEIGGTIRLHGCRTDEVHIQLSAQSVVAYDASVRRIPPKRRAAASHMADVWADSADERLLHFLFTHLDRGDVYRLGIRAKSAACDSMLWDGPADSLAAVGARGETNVAIEGFAAATGSAPSEFCHRFLRFHSG